MSHSPQNTDPPAGATRFLDWFCRRGAIEEIRGDLDEAYATDLEQRGALRANLAYWLEVVLFVRSHTIRRHGTEARTRGPIMFKNYLHVALRLIRKQKAYSSINLLGLAVGLACTFLILMYVRDELSYDRYHADADRIYRLVSGHSDENFDGIAKVNGPYGIAAKEQIAAVESVTRFLFYGPTLFERADQRVYVSGGMYADSTVFDVFSWRLLSGDAETALVAPNSLVLTETLAETWFGNENPIGETIRVAGTTDYRVTGIMQDVPSNSHFVFTFLASVSGYTHPQHDDWVRWNQYYTYLKLSPGANPDTVASASTDLLRDHMDAEQFSLFAPLKLQPLTDIYLKSNMFREIAVMGDATTVAVFFALAIFILLIAAVNFVNLSTARSSVRAREVGVRKSLGAKRGVLVRQFISESILTVFLASLFAVGIIALSLPSFNALAGKSFLFRELLDPRFVVVGAIIVFGIGLLAGIYPAFVLSSYSPVRVFKGQITARGPVSFRKGLVVLQFVISAGLIMGTGIVSDQLRYIQDKPPGFDREHLAGIPIRDSSLNEQYQTLKAEMAAVPGVERVSLSGNSPGGGDWGIPIEIPGMTRDELPSVRMLVGDYDFATTYGLKIAEGRSFDISRATDAERAVLINQEMARQLGWDDAIGKQIKMPAIDRELEVIGVLEDFHYRSMHEAIAPLMVFIVPDDWFSMLSVKLRADSIPAALDGLKAVYERFDLNNPFTFTFMDQQFDNLYVADRQVGRLLEISTLLAILIACLGLFGLAAFTAERRTKEIGVRKVVGASVGKIIILLTRETAILVGIALVIATPLVLVFARDWLDSFAYSGGIKSLTLVVGAFLAFVLAVVTTGIQAWRASHTDPVKALRTE